MRHPVETGGQPSVQRTVDLDLQHRVHAHGREKDLIGVLLLALRPHDPQFRLGDLLAGECGFDGGRASLVEVRLGSSRHRLAVAQRFLRDPVRHDRGAVDVIASRHIEDDLLMRRVEGHVCREGDLFGGICEGGALPEIEDQPLERDGRCHPFHPRVDVASTEQRHLDGNRRFLDTADDVRGNDRQHGGLHHADTERGLARLFPGVAGRGIAALGNIDELREVVPGIGIDGHGIGNPGKRRIGRDAEIIRPSGRTCRLAARRRHLPGLVRGFRRQFQRFRRAAGQNKGDQERQDEQACIRSCPHKRLSCRAASRSVIWLWICIIPAVSVSETEEDGSRTELSPGVRDLSSCDDKLFSLATASGIASAEK